LQLVYSFIFLTAPAKGSLARAGGHAARKAAAEPSAKPEAAAAAAEAGGEAPADNSLDFEPTTLVCRNVRYFVDAPPGACRPGHCRRR